MEFFNINPGLKTRSRQAFTITFENRVFFLTYNERNNTIEWNMFIDDDETKQKVEKILRSYLTNQ